MERTKVFIVPETHWDREWVMTQGQYQVRLVNLMNNLLQIMENNPDYRFLLDGQALVLEDYLEIKPENRWRITSFLKTGQLMAGPWYVLADQFLENGESTIRNLIYGMAVIKELCGKPMMLGYVPDSFGSTSALPMFLNGFNIRYATFGRGRPKWDLELPHHEFWWKGPDGSKVLAASHAYGAGLFLSYPDIWTDITQQPELDPKEMLQRFMDAAKEQQEAAAGPNLYFPVGCDHMEPKASLMGIIEYINEHQKDFELIYGTPEDYLRAVEENSSVLHSYSGEMRGSDQYKMDLVGTLSSRMSLKQENDGCEILLQRIIEPLWSITSTLAGAEYPTEHIRKLWKLLLSNHPHDSICGCCLDQVYKDMINRYEFIWHTGQYLVKDGLHILLSNINNVKKDAEAAVTVVNPLGRRTTGPVRGLVRIPERFNPISYELFDKNGTVVPSCIKIIAEKQKDLESVYMTNFQLATVISKNATPDKPDDQVFTVLEVEFIAEQVPAMGYKTWWLRPVSRENTFRPGVWLCDKGMENSKIKVWFNDNGTLDIFNKRTGYVFSGLNYFVDREDIGNLYDYKGFDEPDEEDSRFYPVKWEVSEIYGYRITFRTTIYWTLPQYTVGGKRSSERNPVTITLYATLYSDADRLDIAGEYENVCYNHCLRVVFDTGLSTDTVSAYDHFSIIERKVCLSGIEWTDHPFQEFVDISDGVKGICLMTRGLPAYEALKTDDGTRLYVTLLRAVGEIGCPSGANHPAPGAQCLGKHRFECHCRPCR